MQTINVNLTPYASQTATLYCSQDDIGRTATINLLDETGAYNIPSGATVTIRATKPNGLGFEEACAVSGNVATVTFSETMTEQAGKFPAELRIVSGDVILGTANIIFKVEKSPHPEGTTDGTSETMQNLTVRMDALEDEVDALDAAKVDATGIDAGCVPTADGQDGWSWEAQGETVEIYVDGTSLVINTQLINGNEVSY